MSDANKTSADDLVAQVDTGARNATGIPGRIVIGLGFVWGLFQLYIASDLPFMLSAWLNTSITVFNNSEARSVHLAFGMVLAALAYPLFKSSPRDRIPWYDWVLALLAASACLYLIMFKTEIARRAGLPTTADLVMSTIGMVTLAIAVYRALGLPLVLVAGAFVFYVFFGDRSFMPDAIQWKGASPGKALWHYWMQSEGVFGVALGVSATMIYLFVLFGSLLEKAGAGNYFIKLAFALLGHLRGGPAKAAVVASALSGMYSGSSIANVVTTGTFTIPLMKRTGFSAEKAGAVEVASSTNGQLTPPVMGAAAFLIAEFTGISYPDILRHAVLPALVSYIALVYIVHIEALKLGLKGLDKLPTTRTLAQTLTGVLFGFLAMAALSVAVYFGLGWIKSAFPDMTFWVASLLLAGAYLFLIGIAARHPELPDNPDADMTVLPRVGEVAVTGYYFLLPIVVLLWCILIERLSPALSAYWATMAMVVIIFTQRPLKALMRGEGALASACKRGWGDFVDGMISGSRNMVGIAVATGAAGVIVGTVSLTGAHQVVGEFVEFLSGGNIMIMLLLVAVMSLILGMGLPTTANYIVVSSLMAPVIVSVGAQSGLIVPLVAVHFFVFYFGILADDTPPVGLAAFAAAAISGGDPIKTGLQGFGYDIRTALLPFLFIFNTELLLIDVSPGKAIFVFVVAVIAMMLFAAATQGYFIARSRIWESAMLLLIAFTLFRPGFWLDQVSPPFEERPGIEAVALAADMPDNAFLRLVISGSDFDKPDQVSELHVLAPLGPKGPDGIARLESAGLLAREEDGKLLLDEPLHGSVFFTKFQMFDFYGDVPVEVVSVQLERERIAKEVFYLPALLLLVVVVLVQRRRQTQPAFWG